jgi:hypothetical protein
MSELQITIGIHVTRKFGPGENHQHLAMATHLNRGDCGDSMNSARRLRRTRRDGVSTSTGVEPGWGAVTVVPSSLSGH